MMCYGNYNEAFYSVHWSSRNASLPQISELLVSPHPRLCVFLEISQNGAFSEAIAT